MMAYFWSGRPSTSSIEQKGVRQVGHEDRRLTVRMITSPLEMKKCNV